MSGKIPGTPRKNASSKKSPAKQSSSVTPIDQATNVNTDGGLTSVRGLNGGQSSALSQPSAQSQIQDQSQNSAQNGNVMASQNSGRGAETSIRRNESAGSRPAGSDLVERIRARAYELFEQRGRREGFHQEDWAQAEAEVLAIFEREKSA